MCKSRLNGPDLYQNLSCLRWNEFPFGWASYSYWFDACTKLSDSLYEACAFDRINIEAAHMHRELCWQFWAWIGPFWSDTCWTRFSSTCELKSKRKFCELQAEFNGLFPWASTILKICTPKTGFILYPMCSSICEAFVFSWSDPDPWL